MYFIFKTPHHIQKKDWCGVLKILLNDVLKYKNISFRKAASKIGISKSTLFDIANGKIDPKLSVLEKIAQGLQTRISDLYDSPYK